MTGLPEGWSRMSLIGLENRVQGNGEDEDYKGGWGGKLFFLLQTT
jgi:hypothetical protein